MAHNHPSGAKPKLIPVQRPLSTFRMSEDEKLAWSLQKEEDDLAEDELLAQRVQEEINMNDHNQTGEDLQQNFGRYRGMTEVDGMLARQLQQVEEHKHTQQAAGLFHKNHLHRQQEDDSDHNMDVRIPNLMRGHPVNRQFPFPHMHQPQGRGRRILLLGQRPPVQPQENLQDGEMDPEHLLMTYSPEGYDIFLNVMRDPHLLLAMLAPQMMHMNEANVDLNDYDSLWELAERLGEVKKKGMTKEQISALPTYKFTSSRSEVSDCQICLSKYQHEEELRTLPCTHEYHVACIDEWLTRNATCPVCRNDVVPN